VYVSHRYSKFKIDKEVKKHRNQGFSHLFCVMMEGSVFAQIMTNSYRGDPKTSGSTTQLICFYFSGCVKLHGYSLQEGAEFLPASLSFSLHSTLSLIGQYHCCGSVDPGSGAFLTPGSEMGKKSESGMNIPDHISESFEKIFGG
jgi:hypothetical protein